MDSSPNGEHCRTLVVRASLSHRCLNGLSCRVQMSMSSTCITIWQMFTCRVQMSTSAPVIVVSVTAVSAVTRSAAFDVSVRLATEWVASAGHARVCPLCDLLQWNNDFLKVSRRLQPIENSFIVNQRYECVKETMHAYVWLLWLVGKST